MQPRFSSGLVLALVSAASFGLAGACAKGLLTLGWTPAAAVVIRMALAGVVLLPGALLALRGRWSALRANRGLVVLYGLTAVALAQFAFFNAVTRLDVGLALLLEYTAPVAVVMWMWLRHDQRPGPLTWLGAVIAAGGLVLMLDLVSGPGAVDLVGVAWALLAMVGAAVYFVIGGRDDTGLPGIVLATGGLLVGSLALGLLGLTGLVPMRFVMGTASYTPFAVPWWVAVLALALVTAALAYVTGIAAARRLGSRLASFVALIEVVAAIGWAWWLLSEFPGIVQAMGGLAILIGVVLVKIGEPKHDVLADPH